MENKKEKIGIRMKDSSGIISHSKFGDGLDVAIDARNSHFDLKQALLGDSLGISRKAKWYKDRNFLLNIFSMIFSAIVVIVIAIIGWKYFT